MQWIRSDLITRLITQTFNAQWNFADETQFFDTKIQ